MAGLRSRYPQAQAWTFVLDSKPGPQVGSKPQRSAQNYGATMGKENYDGVTYPPRPIKGRETLACAPDTNPKNGVSRVEPEMSTDEANASSTSCIAVDVPRSVEGGGVSAIHMPVPKNDDSSMHDVPCREDLIKLKSELFQLRSGNMIDIYRLTEVPGVIDCLQELITDRGRQLAAMDNLSQQLRRSQADAAVRENERKVLTLRLETSEQDAVSLERRLRLSAEEMREERGRWQVHRQELETRLVQLESRDMQYRATMRKKEVEYRRLQDSLQRSMSKERGAARGMEMSSKSVLLSAATQSNERNGTAAASYAPLGGILNRENEKRISDLEEENTTLRGMLVDLQSDLVELRGYQESHHDLVSAMARGEEGWTEAGDEVLPEQVEGMPASWLRSRLGDRIAHQVLAMRAALVRVLGDADADDEDGTNREPEEDAHRKLREARVLLQQQDAIILAAIFDKPGTGDGRGRLPSGVSSMDASTIWEGQENLEEERQAILKQREQLEADKAHFLEEAIRSDTSAFHWSPGQAYKGSSKVVNIPTNSPRAERPPVTDAPAHSPVGSKRGSWPSVSDPSVGTPSPVMKTSEESSQVSSQLTFTPPEASPDTTQLLEGIGVVPGVPMGGREGRGRGGVRG